MKPMSPNSGVIILESEYSKKYLKNVYAQKKSIYGITEEQFKDLAKRQGDACASCGVDATGLIHILCVDHDHYTNEIRGLLCHDCNTAAGWLSDDPIKAEKLAEYLKHNGTGLFVPITGA